MSFSRVFIENPSYGSLFSAVFSERSVDVERGISYGKHARQSVDVYRPRTIADNTPVVIFFNSGGWDSGERAYYGFVGSALALPGFITVILDYRLYPEIRYPEFMADAAQAYSWAFKNLTMQTGRLPIFVMGHSAGAHIGALLTYNQAYLLPYNKDLPMPGGFIGLSGPYGFDPTVHKRSKHIFSNAKNAAEAQSVFQVSKGAAPALLMHGKKDTTILTLNALRMRDALFDVGTHAEAIEFQNIGHIGSLLVLSKSGRLRAPILPHITRVITNIANSAKPY